MCPPLRVSGWVPLGASSPEQPGDAACVQKILCSPAEEDYLQQAVEQPEMWEPLFDQEIVGGPPGPNYADVCLVASHPTKPDMPQAIFAAEAVLDLLVGTCVLAMC